MQCDTEENKKDKTSNAEMEVELQPLLSPSTDDHIVVSESTYIAPVIIEELDENTINTMDVDINEFVEATALKVHEVSENTSSSSFPQHTTDTMTDVEDTDVPLATDEEDLLTRQFLSGELTFSEYSSRMDQDLDLETVDVESSRKECEMEQTMNKKIPMKKPPKSTNLQTRQKRKKRTLPPALQGLMGEANLRFARGEITLAAQMCMEIIRQVPSAPEPFHTLAMIYENDQPDKSLQFALIAAHLSPKDADQWVRLANLSLESGNIKQAITCYSKAIQASPKDINLYETRAQLQEQNGDKRAYLRAYTKLVHNLEPEDGDNIVKYAKMLAKRYMQENNNEQALEAMENIFTKCPDLITLEEVNVMTEILISLKQFTRCLDILTKYTSVWVKYGQTVSTKSNSEKMDIDRGDEHSPDADNNKEKSENSFSIEACGIPDDVVVDLKAKCLITLIELNEIKIADELLPKLYLKDDPEASGDLFLDVAEALMGKKEFERALVLLEPLVNSQTFSLAAVWLRHAECWVGCKNYEKAIKSYEIVRKLSPQHLGARLELAKLYKLKGHFNKAVEVLKQDPETDALDPDALYERTILLLKLRKYDDYFASGMLLLSRHCITIRNKRELRSLARATGIRQRLEILQLHRLSCGESIEDENAPTFLESEKLTEKKEFNLFLQMCKLACDLKRHGLLQRICFSALTSKRFENRNSHILFLCLVACIHNNDSFYGYNIVRDLVRGGPKPNLWNLLNIIIQKAEDSRHNRFIMRLLGREDAFSYLHIMHANNCLVSGTYKYALNDYVSLFRVRPSALLALLVSVTLLQMGCQKLSTKRNQLVIQALAFLKKYQQLRGKKGHQETYYNIARAFHQIGLLPTATHYYKKVLECDPGDLVRQNPRLLDLKREAAFNLHLIYLQSENRDLARMYLEEYITV